MRVKIALAGNPNSGKTTLFNALTGSNQFVGNWPGVTVEKKEGKRKEKLKDIQRRVRKPYWWISRVSILCHRTRWKK